MVGILKALAFTGGEWVIYVLIACSILSAAIIIERAVILAREKKATQKLHQIFLEFLDRGMRTAVPQEINEAKNFSSAVLKSGIAYMTHGHQSVQEHLSAAAFKEKQKLDLRMTVLGTLGNNAVYIGLFGTVLGVIKAFHDLGQEAAGPEMMMQGLSEALVATAIGLLVALPCVVAYNVFQKQIKDIVADTDSMASMLMGRLKSDKLVERD